MTIPIIIIDSPSIFFFVIFSFRNNQLKKATNRYPRDSRIDPIESGITVYAQIEQNVAAKKMIYAKITLALRYSMILFG